MRTGRPPITKGAGVYYRVSTYDKQDVGMQVKVIREYCEREGITIVKEYTDRGQSGAKESRPAFDEMLKDMRNYKFNTIVVYKLDRIGRSLPHLVKLFEEFQKKNIDFISATQNINTKTPEGKMFLGMLMVLSEYERELTVNRILSGQAAALAKGKKLGRPKGRKDKKKRRVSGYHRRWSEDAKKALRDRRYF